MNPLMCTKYDQDLVIIRTCQKRIDYYGFIEFVDNNDWSRWKDL